ncbi:MAG TPA: cupin domain-containing protein [Ktedonosporobacter sp.]|nr:cupin domain-containing protein [Ktedonosporobacter sp.]
MAIVRATESPRFDLPHTRFFGLLAPSRGSTELCTWRLEVDPGEGPAHQLDHEEAFVMLEGSLTFTLNGETFDLGPGDALAVPAHTWFSASNRTGATAKALISIRSGFRATMASGEEINTPPWAL